MFGRQQKVEFNSRLTFRSGTSEFGSSGSSFFNSGSGGGSSSSGYGGAMQGGSGEKGGSSKKGGSSLGFIVGYVLVLSIAGYVIINDKSATAGGLSLFASSSEEEEEGSFLVKPQRFKSRTNSFDWSRKKSGDELKKWEKSGIRVDGLFGSGEAPVYRNSQKVSSNFLTSGQLEQTLWMVTPGKSNSGFQAPAVTYNTQRASYDPVPSSDGSGTQQPNMPAASAEAHSEEIEWETPSFDIADAQAAKYQLYSFATPKPAGVVEIDQRSMTTPDERAELLNNLRIVKGRLSKVSNRDGYTWQIDLKIDHGSKLKASTIAIAAQSDEHMIGTTGSLEWSDALSTYFYQLTPGAHAHISMRGREQLSGFLFHNSAVSAQGTVSAGKLSANLSDAAKRKLPVYFLLDMTSEEKTRVRAVLLQDLSKRDWKVFRLPAPKKAEQEIARG